ncbi:MAG: cob(I)yrinic acid a,c-diamide adenosyltransferase [Chloroflexi bacterium]|nr:cob(I)yrinic acid a,c-diamide adenosyltransferase [Chloroflexota bacterium]
MNNKKERKGLVIVNTGNGKGKTTAAVGTLFRSYGHGFRICVIQFIKAEEVKTGEFLAAQSLGIEWHYCGDGFVFESETAQNSAEIAREGWRLAKEKISDQKYDLVILDEFTYPLKFGWLDISEVIDWLKDNKPSTMHLVITGRNALPELIDYADLVTEMKEIKHPYREQKIPAQIGTDF